CGTYPGKHDQAAGFPVQPVHERDIRACVQPRAPDEAGPRVTLCRMTDESGGLADDEEFAVVMDDGGQGPIVRRIGGGPMDWGRGHPGDPRGKQIAGAPWSAPPARRRSMLRGWPRRPRLLGLALEFLGALGHGGLAAQA